MRLLYTLDDVAYALGTEPAKIANLVERGLMPPPLLLDGVPHWRRATIRAWLRRIEAVPSDLADVLTALKGDQP